MQFPESTKRNAKYKTILIKHLSGLEKKELQTKVENVVLSNVINTKTLNVEKGERFKEIIVFDYFLKEKSLSDKQLTSIEQIIPNYILHILHFGDEIQIVACYKEKTQSGIKVIKFFRSDWLDKDFNLEKMQGDIDTIYENFITQVSSGKVQTDETTDIKQAVEDSVEKEKLQRKIDLLKNKIRKEPQFNKQLVYKKELKELKEQLNKKGNE